MQIGPIALKLRLEDTRFQNNIFGSAVLEKALEHTLKAEMAFVIQLNEVPNPNTQDNAVIQKITERFAVIVALDNGSSDKDKLGFIAYNKLADIRAEIFSAILGWQMPKAESLISYGGGRISGINRGYLWYQFEFLVDFRIDSDDGVDVGADDLSDFESIYAQWILTPSAKMDAIGNLPVTLVEPDMTSIIDFTSNPAIDGGFGRGFGFTWYRTFKGE